MSTLSITFHCTESHLKQWDEFLFTTLQDLVKNTAEISKYMFSEVQTDYLNEGKNYNLLIIFSESDNRQFFMENTLSDFSIKIEEKFGNEIMIFATPLNLLESNF